MSNLDKAYAAILKYGTPKQKDIVRSIQKSSIRILIETLNGSGSCGVTDTATTQYKVDSQKINETEALGELTLRINPVTETNNVGLEGTLIHETRHAYHQARAISEFSYIKNNPYDPDRFTLEYAAHTAYGEYVLQVIRLNHPDKQAFINESLSLGVTEKAAGGKIVISDAGIRRRLLNGYKVNDTTQKGGKFSDRYKIYPRSSW
jgi:hypothetical protein